MAILWTDAQMLQLCDNVAVTLSDALAYLPTTAQGTALINDIKTEYNRIRVINDQVLLGILMPSYLSEMQRTPIGLRESGRLVGWFSSIDYENTMKKGPYPILDAADLIATQMTNPGNGQNYTGLNEWLGATVNTVHQYFADCFNQFVADVGSDTYIRTIGNEELSFITSDKIFVAANTDIRTITATSSSAISQTPVPLTSLINGLAAPGGGTFEAYAKTAIGASAYSLNVTYTSMAGASGLTGTITVPANATINTVLSTTGFSQPVGSIGGVALVGTATTNDQVGFRVKPVRTVVQ